jgi:hypothetical protein
MTLALDVTLWRRAHIRGAFKRRIDLLLDLAQKLETMQNTLDAPLADNAKIVVPQIVGAEVLQPAADWLRRMSDMTMRTEAAFGEILPPKAKPAGAADVYGARNLQQIFLKNWPDQREKLPAFLRECCRIAGYEWPTRGSQGAVSVKAQDVIKANDSRNARLSRISEK